MKRFMRISSAFVVVIILSVGICAGPCAGWRAGICKWQEGGSYFSVSATVLGVRVGEPIVKNRYCADFETCWFDLPWWSTDFLVEQNGAITVWPRWYFSLAAILPDPANPGWYTMPRMDAYLLAKVGCDQVAVPDIVDSFFDVYVSIDVEQWINGQGVLPPPGSQVSVSNGTSPMLPGIQVGTSEIVFEPAYGWVNSNPYTGTMLVLGRMTLEAQIPPYMCLGMARRQEDGMLVNTSGIVTYKSAGFLYIEPPDRTSGIRVETSAADPTPGDDLPVVGTLATVDGERCIRAVMDPIASTSGNAIPAPFSLRSRDVGGDDLDVNNPGVTDGRGALNVGLRVTVQGMVTYRDTSATPTYFYIWDGANRVNTPLDDGSGHYGVRILHSGYIDPAGVVPWTDWVSVTGVVSATDQAVVGKVIPQIIPTATPARVTAFNAIHADPGTALRANWNLIGLPAAPAATGSGLPPEKDVSQMPWEAQQVLAPTKQYSEVDGRVTRHENSNQGIYIFDEWSEPLGAFGGMLIGDGYWVKPPVAWPVNYSGKNSSLDQWYGIKSAGTPLAPKWILVGHPKDHYTLWDDAKMHDGAQIVTMETASTRNLGWIETSGLWFDNSVQGLKDIGVTEDYPATQTLRPWHGYWFKVYSSGKSIIFPESPVAPPPP